MEKGIYPLMPYGRKTVWAGTRLKRFFGRSGIGEAYLFSALKTASSAFRDGTLLADSEEQIGLSLLIKLIDAEKPLSVQVHPSQQNGGENFFKDELWLIREVYADPLVSVGFSRDITRKELRAGVAEGKLTSLMRQYVPAPGDWFYIPGGTIHWARGVVFYEIQNDVDVTYRLDDHGRGRSLSLVSALEALDLSAQKPLSGKFFWEKTVSLPDDAPFSVDILTVNGTVFCCETSFCCYLCAEGTGTVSDERGRESFSDGLCFFIYPPASFSLTGNGIFLKVW